MLPAPASRRRVRERFAWSITAALCAVAVAVALAFFLRRRETPRPAPLRFTVVTPGNGSLPLFGRPVVSPDGQWVIFGVSDPAGKGPVWYLHSLATSASTILHGTENIIAVDWSFDSRSVLLRRFGALWRMDVKTGSRQRLPVSGAYSSWQPEGIVAGGQRGLQWFMPDGSGARWVKKREDDNGTAYSYPSLIPGGRWLLYNAENADGATPGFAVRLTSLDGKVDREILRTEHPSIYGGPGYLLWLRDGVLMAHGIDPGNGTLRGNSSPVAGPIAASEVATDRLGSFSVSNNGVLAFRNGAVDAENRLTWFDRSGAILGTLGGVADYSDPALSPDGRHLAVAIRDPATATRDIWILDLARDAPVRITVDPGDDFDPSWSPDGTRVSFVSDRLGGRRGYVKSASGTGDESPQDPPGPADDQRQSSPDGKWMAYRSNETGRFEVFIRGVPPRGGNWRVSDGGGTEPQWGSDGHELFYLAGEGPTRVMAVEVSEIDGAMRAGVPHPLFDLRLPGGTPRRRFVAARDGKKFLATVPVEPRAAHRFSVVVNWPSLLRK